MPAVLEPATVAPISVELYEQRGEAVYGRLSELIRGFVVKRMSLTPRHVFLVEELDELVRAVLPKTAHSRQEKPLKFTDSMPEPDLAVVPGRRGDYGEVHPTSALWVVEVAVTGVAPDRRKAAIYAEADIPEYWIVLVEKEAVEVYTDPQNGQYTRKHRYSREETITSVALPALSVDLGALFASRQKPRA